MRHPHFFALRTALLVCGYLMAASGIQAQSNSINLAAGLELNYSFDYGNFSSRTGKGPKIILQEQARLAANRFGADSSALVLDGRSQSALIPFSEEVNLDKRDGYSLSFWLKPRDDNQGCLLLKENDYGVKWNGMRKALVVFDGFGAGIMEGDFSSWSSAEWYHIAVTKERETLSLYINGSLDRAFEVKRKDNAESKDVHIGKHPYFWGGFTGMIDDLALYSRPLNKLEVLAMSQIENIPLEAIDTPPVPDLDPEIFLGLWKGIVMQPDNELVDSYAYWFNFQRMEDGRLLGYSRIEVPEDQAFGVTRIQAFISGNLLSFEEVQVYKQKNYLGYKWCKKYGQLAYDPETETLQGSWYANNCGGTGTIFLQMGDGKFNYHDNRLSEKISLDELKAALQKPNAEAQLREKLLSVELAPIQFTFGTNKLTSASQRYLQEALLPVFDQDADLKLRVVGFTDNIGDANVNLALSRARAEAVCAFLSKGGVASQRLSALGMGEAQPIATNTSPEGRAQNRRVEFEIYFE